MSVLTFGEALIGYVATDGGLREATRFERFAGGAELNVAVGLSRLGQPVCWAGVLGEDAHADALADRIASLGIETMIIRRPGPTGVMFKAAPGPGDPEVLQLRSDTAFAQHADQLLDHLADHLAGTNAFDGVDHLHLTGIVLGVSAASRSLAHRLVAAARAAGRTVSFDPNLRLNLWPDPVAMREEIDAVAAQADVVLPGLAEGHLLTGQSEPEAIAEHYLQAGAGEVVVKLGAAGAIAYTGHDVVRSRTFDVDPVDTVGAGDGFAAGYLDAFCRGAGLQTRLDRAAAVGALVTTRPGDLDAMPQSHQVDALLAHSSPSGQRADGGLER